MTIENNSRPNLTEQERTVARLKHKLNRLKLQYHNAGNQLFNAQKWHQFPEGMTMEDLIHQHEMVKAELESTEKQIERESKSVDKNQQ